MTLEVDIRSAMGLGIRLDGDFNAIVNSWLPRDEIEQGTMQQIENIASLPNAVAVAVMPDAHKGYGMPIGTALATEGAVVPYAVGVDIGCGMVAVPMSISAEELAPKLRQVLEGVFARVPVGQPTKASRDRGQHKTRQNSIVLREWAESDHFSLMTFRDALRDKYDFQLGSLGGGNHFIELQADERGMVWLMLHSGSRGFGFKVGNTYYQAALELNTKYCTPLPDKELAFLPLESREGQAYLQDMGYAMRFAEESRHRMEYAVYDALSEAGIFDVWQAGRRVETHHNFAAIEKHFGRTVVVHRKGAVRTTDTVGSPGGDTRAAVTIPGSMQTGSYIGLGKANKLAMNTCSHGAGRVLGRNAVKKANVGVDIRKEMAEQGIVLICPDESDVLDESGRAYKDIENVMKYQADLVDPVVKLRPLGAVKG